MNLYSALIDKEIDRRQEETKELNAQLIREFKKLPFWKSWSEEEALKMFL